MAMTNPYQTYHESQIFTASPEKLLLMLFDGAIRFCQTAEQAILEKNISAANENLVKVQNIVLELLASLDRSYPVSDNLASLYDYMHRKLIEANFKKDREIVEEVRGYLKELRDTFAQAAQSVRISNQRGVTSGGINIEK